MGYLISWLLIPLKVVVITVVANFHKLRLRYKYRNVRVPTEGEPSELLLAGAYVDLKLSLEKELGIGPTGKLLYLANPDHQALRHGSVTWSVPTIQIIEGMENYIKDDGFVRGFTSPYDAPPAVPTSIAHAIATAHLEKYVISDTLRDKFLGCVDALIAKEFEQSNDTSTKPRLASNGFDAIFALSMLYTAYSLSKDEKYIKEANRTLYLKGYALLLLAPTSYLNDKRRNFWMDHMSLYALRTAIIFCPDPKVKWLLKHAFKFIHSQGYVYGNPFTAAMALECGVLPEAHRKMVLAVHASTAPYEACVVRYLATVDEQPNDFSSHSADEFIFDDVLPKGLEKLGDTGKRVWLNGLCLCKSLLMLKKG